MKEKEKRLVVGALLHDIGKLWQRGLDERKKHGALAANVLEKAGLPVEIADCARYHHGKELGAAKLECDNLAYIVYEADNIAAGADRREHVEQDDEMEGVKGGFNKKAALESVFNLLPGEKTNLNYRFFTIGNDISYPGPDNTISQSQYQTITDYFNGDFGKNLTEMSPNVVLKICEKFLSAVPSDTHRDNIPDISLYDHQKITASVASCMYKYFEAAGITDFRKACYPASNRDEEIYLLLSADLSGVQDFIYTISSKGALKSLRARSFYLELFLEHVADEILEALGLSRANLLYTGGGHFYILAPNTAETKKIITDARDKINNWLFDEFGATLYIAIGLQACTANQLMRESTGIFSAVGRELAKEKLRKYADNPKLLEKVFTPRENADSGRECAVCSASSKKLSKWPYSDDGSGIFACPLCIALYQFGKELVEHDKYSIVSGARANCLLLPGLDGEYCSVVADVVSGARRLYSKNRGDEFTTQAINLWMGDYNWRADGKTELADFSDFAERPEGGIKRLGCIRADVDNLGAVFNGISGIPEKHSTLTRVSVLSRQLNRFFKSYINSICGERRLAIVYSGGDDVFAVGAWDDVISFATDLRADFAKFTCGKLTFSAGISLLPEKFPVWQMAAVTGELEEKAKANVLGKLSKDSLALFGNDDCEYSENADHKKIRHVYFWDEFNDQVVGEKQKLFADCFEWTKKNSDDKLIGSTAFMYKLKQLIHDSLIPAEHPPTKTPLTTNGQRPTTTLNIARLAYSLARIDPNSNNENKQRRYERVRENIYTWVKAEQQARQLYTAIDLMIYQNRGGE